MLFRLLLIGAGGAAGSMARFLLGNFITVQFRGTFPWGTLAVNLLGSLAIGLLTGLAGERGWFTDNVRSLLVTGLLGGFTTFSAFGNETISLFRNGDTPTAFLYVLASILIGLAAVWVGYKLGTVL